MINSGRENWSYMWFMESELPSVGEKIMKNSFGMRFIK